MTCDSSSTVLKAVRLTDLKSTPGGEAVQRPSRRWTIQVKIT